MINWIRLKQRWRAEQIILKKKKPKNHTRVRLRFKLTRFGWERLSAKRHGSKFNMNDRKYRKTMGIKYVHRNDLQHLARQLPGYKLRIRDCPIDNNPNIQRVREHIGLYFG